MPDWPARELTIHSAPNRYLAAKTRLFIDYLVDQYGPRPSWDAFDLTAQTR